MKLWNKQAAMILCVCMFIASCVSGTLAYLTNEAGDTNTFVIGKIDIELTETDTRIDEDEDDTTNTYKIESIGQIIDKDPKVTLLSGSAPCWLFVQVSESANFDEFLSFEIAEGWTALEGNDGVYYRAVDKRTLMDTEYSVLKDDVVLVKNDVTAEQLNALTAETCPTLTVNAYAVQHGEKGTVLGTAKDAWKQLQEEKE